MAYIQNLPIKRKLILIVTLTSFFSLSISGLALILYEKEMHRQILVEELSVLAGVISDKSTAAQDFNDPNLAKENLLALSVRPSIILACIYSESNTILAAYPLGLPLGVGCPPEPDKEGHRFSANDLKLVQSIVRDEARIGTIYIRSDLREIEAHLLRDILVVASVVFLGTLISYLFSLKFQKLITGPIILLADTVRDISKRGDYSVRAEKKGQDEIGTLTDGFNAMLGKIEKEQVNRDRAEDLLKKHRKHLEELVQERTEALDSKNKELSQSRDALTSLLEDVNESRDDLNEANQKLKELDRLKTMFIASMSHELKTPLNSIIGFTGIILEGMSGEINPDQRDQLQRVYGSAHHLLELISGIIDISRIEAGEVETSFTIFSLDEVILEAVGSLKPQLEEKGLEIETDLPHGIMLKSDRTRLLQCILNYLSNALKFTEQGTISIVVKEDDTMIEISVKDTGVGIKTEDIPKLFTPFFRGDTPLKKIPPGTGLGLYLTKKLVDEVLGGSVAMESQYGQGSTFILKIPVKT